ncbi:hypothetical protein BOX15_Mlig003693g1 [Macrostomum lignano]|uniref:TNFR-Cys domain-containing protein n=1 Tax=Macrostomum lignano TaxID=282301 RepID=A0A267H681_9PLAT|nr:hypothetical protein BOX15_Mlig003693g1 [Macrostomum lignano]
MARLLLLLITAAVCTDGGLAISCFSRGGSTDGSNGTAISCPGFPYCYSYSKGPEHFAGCTSCRNVQDGYQCNSTSSCTLGDSCQVCSSDFCNAVYPSSISCFYRRGMPSNANDNGTKINCYYGVATCYTYMSSTSNYVGCGDCSTRDDPTCVTCNSAYCNTINPSSISCYVGTQNYGGSLRNGSAIACPTGVTSCFAYRRLSTRNVYSSSVRCSSEFAT